MGILGSGNTLTKNIVNDALDGIHIYAGSSGTILGTGGSRNTFFNVQNNVLDEDAPRWPLCP